MHLHFDEPIDKTKENSAVFEFFQEDNNSKILNINKIRGKSLAHLIKERKITKHYNRKKHLTLQLHLLHVLVTLGCVVCAVMIIYILSQMSY